MNHENYYALVTKVPQRVAESTIAAYVQKNHGAFEDDPCFMVSVYKLVEADPENSDALAELHQVVFVYENFDEAGNDFSALNLVVGTGDDPDVARELEEDCAKGLVPVNELSEAATCEFYDDGEIVLGEHYFVQAM